MAGPKPTLAFFGATGGSTISCIAPAIEAGYKCNALVRTPSKLENLLRERKVSDSAIAANLQITAGNVTDVEAVKKTLVRDGANVDIVISGIGGKLLFTNPLKPTLDNPTICQDAVSTIISALNSLAGPKPTLVALSTTGISDKKRDLPVAMMPMYHWMLKVPHKDKKVMEAAILKEVAKPEGERAISDYVIVRPSLLTDGPSIGTDKIKAGTEEKPAVGYTITRDDVGLWVFEKLIKENHSYHGQIVTITA
ncbi:hypothetical protein DTO166G4_528 [Paecilomyces variotii]|nr:hypothetical protein DTO032I3_6391 [Paecilomyces variotii]KAJ9197187.1 hypothetical protein DTO164E3_5901 [Paecilomyces variotii]KAJ9217724.1 hypothetical protein DTO166G4_528 [Paecilomyces variotii]KAJ9221897.1 hypothetical protein DTO169C6_5691 [Paecilomyces variotii]KAJ9237260.1 hypothetical protein DTO166G5_3656 [Paecilomyces variotii]